MHSWCLLVRRYSLEATLDAALAHFALREGKIKVGAKLGIGGAKLTGQPLKHALHPLRAKQLPTLQIHANGKAYLLLVQY